MKGLVKKKGVALLLCVSMLSALSLSAVDSLKTNAAEKTTAPSVTAYASKDDLENKFAPDSGNIGKLKFGKSNQEWYILGIDSGVNSGKDNTAIFAASNMSGTLAFQADYEYDTSDNKYYYKGDRTISGAGVTYEGSSSLTRFYANHYGLSDARNTLREMIGDSSNYFTSKEIELMNETTVKTEDLFNTNEDTPRSYTTSDKLYLPYGNYNTNNQIYIGSDDSKKLGYSNYWGTGAWFWLRAPCSGDRW